MSKLYAGLSVLKDGSFSFEDALLYYTDTPLSYFIIEAILKRKKETTMSEKNRNNKTGGLLRCTSILDLRNYTPEALLNMGKYKAVGILVLPKEAPEGFMEAYAQVDITAVGTTIYTDKDKEFKTINGASVLSNSTMVFENCIYIINGMAVCAFDKTPENTEFLINGLLVKRKDVQINCIAVNGYTVEVDFDPDNFKFYDKGVVIDKSFINNLEKGTLIIASGDIDFNKNVTAEDIVEKDLRFLSSKDIKCKRNIFGIVQSRSSYRNRIVKKLI